MLRTRVLAALALSTMGMAFVGCDSNDLTDIDESGSYGASLSSTAIVPAPNGNSTGTATASLELDDGDLTVTITINDAVTSGVTGARLHGPSSNGTNADIVFDFTPSMATAIGAGATVGTVLQAEYELEEIAPSASGQLRIDPHTLIDMLNNGQVYVTLTTSENPDGELRGQVDRH